MVDNIVELENGKKYVLLDEKKIDKNNYYFGLRLDNNEEPTNNYLFFEEIKDCNDVYLLPIDDEKLKSLLLTAFTVNYVDKSYDSI